MNLQENRRQSPNFRQIQLQQFPQFLLPVKYFGIFHGRLLNAVTGKAMATAGPHIHFDLPPNVFIKCQ
jgi:hypothetical protein